MSVHPEERLTQCLGLTLASRVWHGGESGAQTSPVTVVALHGWQDNAASFDALGRALSEQGPAHWTLHALDLPGHGQSSYFPPSQSYNLWDYGLAVHAYIEQLDGPVWLCGHSLGGMVATLLLAAHPNHIAGLITLDMLGLSSDPPEAQVNRVLTTLQAHCQGVSANRPSPTWASALDRRQRAGSPGSLEAIAALVERGTREQDGQWHFRLDPRVRLGSVLRFNETQVIQLCGVIQAPWHVILGESGLFTRGFTARAQSALPNLRIHWWPGGHHFHMETAPEELWRYLAERIMFELASSTTD